MVAMASDRQAHEDPMTAGPGAIKVFGLAAVEPGVRHGLRAKHVDGHSPPAHGEVGYSPKTARSLTHPARIIHAPSAATADPSAGTRRAPSIRLDVVSTTPSPSSGPRATPRQRLDGLATNVHEYCGLGPGGRRSVGSGTRAATGQIGRAH